MEKVVNVSKNELQEIKAIIGEAFITNELFHEFGNIESRRDHLSHVSLHMLL